MTDVSTARGLRPRGPRPRSTAARAPATQHAPAGGLDRIAVAAPTTALMAPPPDAPTAPVPSLAAELRSTFLIFGLAAVVVTMTLVLGSVLGGW